jgi:hypothetical protein
MDKFFFAYLSSGIIPTGGYRHEHFLFHSITGYFSEKGINVKSEVSRKEKYFHGLENFGLLYWAWKKSEADVLVVPSRLALSAILRGIFSKKAILIVMHYFDEGDGKGILLRWYYKLLFGILRSYTLKGVAVVTVAPYWQQYFSFKFKGKVPVFHYPNFFNVEEYGKYKSNTKLRQVHLGQYSSKNEPALFDLAEKLHENGYFCYFTTLQEQEACRLEHYSVLYEPREAYLTRMASSLYSVAFIRINEGWNRVAHESILVGTPVVGNDAGGLGDLLRESGSRLIVDRNDLLKVIIHQKNTSVTQPDFEQKYDTANVPLYLAHIVDFISKRLGI